MRASTDRDAVSPGVLGAALGAVPVNWSSAEERAWMAELVLLCEGVVSAESGLVRAHRADAPRGAPSPMRPLAPGTMPLPLAAGA
ncbi:MAG: hypothetical protein ACK4NM_18830 [Hydrogenophaga sp.]